MGVYAHGGGDATVKSVQDMAALKEMLDTKLFASDMKYEFSISENRIYFDESDDHWHADNTFEFLNTLSPYISVGMAEYDGDDGLWCYRFNPETSEWDVRQAIVMYEDDLSKASDDLLLMEVRKRIEAGSELLSSLQKSPPGNPAERPMVRVILNHGFVDDVVGTADVDVHIVDFDHNIGDRKKFQALLAENYPSIQYVIDDCS